MRSQAGANLVVSVIGRVILFILVAQFAFSGDSAEAQNSGSSQTAAQPSSSAHAEPGARLGPPAITIPRLQRPPALEDFLSMKPKGEIALQMAKVTGFTQRNPHDGEAASEPTEAYLGYDQKNLYAVFVCFDDPRQVRARMSPREDIHDDDEVEIMLDTFHDRRRAYAFQTTPLGVQWDAIWTEASREEQSQGHFDTSFDTVWDSRGKVTSRGFVVWIAIPFKSLRFPAKRIQEWGVILYRGITRKTEDSFWPEISRKVEGRLGQAATLYGLEGISPGRDLQLIPYGLMRGFHALDTRDPYNPYFQNANVQGQPGIDGKFVIQDHFVVDVTANPDFSQIESEEPQITVNQRYAVYFPELRPFFLENEDFFRTPMELFFTRSIGDPSAGIRLTGKDGPYSVGMISTDDRSPGLAVPDYSQYSGIRSYFTIARINRDIFKQSSVGALYTDWECPSTGEYNRIGGVDTRLKFSPNWTLDGQAVASSSNLNLSCEANLDPFSSGNLGNGSHYGGPAERLDLVRDGLHFNYEGMYNDISPGFVSIPGFINRVDIRETKQEVRYRFRPKRGWITAWGPSLNMRYDFDHTGLRLDTFYAPYFLVAGRGQTYIWIRPYEEFRERLRPQDFCFYDYVSYCPAPVGTGLTGNQDYHEHQSGATFSTAYLKFATLGASYYWGDGVNFEASPDALPAPPTPYNLPFLAREDTGQATLSFRPLKPLKIENGYLFERLRTTGSTYLFEEALYPGAGHGIFNDHIIRSKWNWQFTPQLSMRVILQYNSLLAGTPLSGTGISSSPYTYLPTAKEFNADFLVTYLVHPGTAIYVGYNSDLQNLNVLQQTPTTPGGVTNTAKGFLNDSRQFFVKVSYMFRF
ncbi:MAG TPA: carbohydrate binding family 9 domain-containing protein [Verrucomicrobiae bacterium]|nr:carbohydrate binding family 9 domain-containing protein [Verrucomicrobiae bacterium]